MTKTSRGSAKAVKSSGSFWKPWLTSTATLVRHSVSGVQKFAANLLFNDSDSSKSELASLHKELLRLQSKIEDLEKRSSVINHSVPETATTTATSLLDGAHKPKSTQRVVPPRESVPAPAVTCRPPPLPFAANDLKVMPLNIISATLTFLQEVALKKSSITKATPSISSVAKNVNLHLQIKWI